MKLYEFSPFPNPRRVRVFLAEKGVKVDSVSINVPEGEHRGEHFLKINPWAGVPVLELDDGTHIAETMAICNYVEAAYPTPPLLGKTPKERGVVEMWQRRIEQNLFERLTNYFHYATPGLGALETYQNKDFGEQCLKVALNMLEKLDGELENKEYIAGDFSVADITALCGIDFANFLQLDLPSGLDNVNAWHQRLTARPSAAA